MKQKKFFLESCEEAKKRIFYISKDKAFYPPGKNGPYFDIETPLRNTSHQLVSFSIAYFLTKDKEYREVGLKLLNFLRDRDLYSIKNSYVHRQKIGKDWSNGVIGQAWIAEAFLYAGKCFEIKEIEKEGVDLLKGFEFDMKKKAWKSKDPVQSGLYLDRTYNHQSWYASVAAETEEEKLLYQVKEFLDCSLEKSFDVYGDGLIKHLLQNTKKETNPLKAIDKILEKIILFRRISVHKTSKKSRDIGYHLYDLYTLARLRLNYPNHNIWGSKKIEKALNYITDNNFLDLLEDNKYSYPYNGPGFELPLISLAFNDINSDLATVSEKSFERQLEKTWDENLKMFLKNTYDPVTLSVRIYELGLAIYYQEKGRKV